MKRSTFIFRFSSWASLLKQYFVSLVFVSSLWAFDYTGFGIGRILKKKQSQFTRTICNKTANR
jgi:hypothetical protein